MAYDNDDTLNPDLAALETRQADLRLFVEEMTDIVMALPMPETFAEADRAVRAVTAADRMLVQLYTPAKTAKAGRPVCIDDIDEIDEEPYDEADPMRHILEHRLAEITRETASGYWPDGSDYNPENLDYWQTTPSDVIDAAAAANRAAGKPVTLVDFDPQDLIRQLEDAVRKRNDLAAKSIPT
ncbi:MAG: hypothetical protein WDN06_19445 [Asticcacaulis sp.]